MCKRWMLWGCEAWASKVRKDSVGVSLGSSSCGSADWGGEGSGVFGVPESVPGREGGGGTTAGREGGGGGGEDAWCRCRCRCKERGLLELGLEG